MAGLSPQLLEKYLAAFNDGSKYLFAQNVVTKQDPSEVCISRKSLETLSHVFTHKVEAEGKPISNQKNSGRCWIFACLNVMRLPFMKQYNLEEFEFSAAHLFFWDKIERCNYLLRKVVDIARRGDEQPSGRLLSFLMSDPVSDGGQWNMLVNLINKHGVMPKVCFPEAYSDEHSVRMNNILRCKMREYTKILFDLVRSGDMDASLSAQTEEMIGEIYRICGICLGIPSTNFTWEYYDKNKLYNSIGPISSKDFYDHYVKVVYDVNDKVCLVTDPRPTNPYGKLYIVDCLGNMHGGNDTLYNNQPVELLMKLAAESIKNNEAVWFGCDVGKNHYGPKGILDVSCLNYKLVFGVDVYLGLDKSDRLVYGESKMSHAMVFTAVSLDAQGEPTKWRVENSWGEEHGEKGYLIMSSNWFREFAYEVVVDKKFVPSDVLDVFKQDPIVLPAWDPMGALTS